MFHKDFEYLLYFCCMGLVSLRMWIDLKSVLKNEYPVFMNQPTVKNIMEAVLVLDSALSSEWVSIFNTYISKWFFWQDWCFNKFRSCDSIRKENITSRLSALSSRHLRYEWKHIRYIRNSERNRVDSKMHMLYGAFTRLCPEYNIRTRGKRIPKLLFPYPAA